MKAVIFYVRRTFTSPSVKITLDKVLGKGSFHGASQNWNGDDVTRKRMANCYAIILIHLIWQLLKMSAIIFVRNF